VSRRKKKKWQRNRVKGKEKPLTVENAPPTNRGQHQGLSVVGSVSLFLCFSKRGCHRLWQPPVKVRGGFYLDHLKNSYFFSFFPLIGDRYKLYATKEKGKL